MKKDVGFIVKHCNNCQRHAPTILQFAEPLHVTIPLWPFMRWGMDIVRKLLKAVRQKEYVILATDYFSNWIEVEALAWIKDVEVIFFVWRNIICRFGVRKEIITDTQFTYLKFQDWCKELVIKLLYSSPRYLQTNGLTESTNKNNYRSHQEEVGRVNDEISWRTFKGVRAYRTTVEHRSVKHHFCRPTELKLCLPLRLKHRAFEGSTYRSKIMKS